MACNSLHFHTVAGIAPDFPVVEVEEMLSVLLPKPTKVDTKLWTILEGPTMHEGGFEWARWGGPWSDKLNKPRVSKPARAVRVWGVVELQQCKWSTFMLVHEHHDGVIPCNISQQK